MLYRRSQYIIATLFACLAVSPMATAQLTPQKLTPAELSICQNTKHCLDILSRHDEHSFDYAVLSQAFASFGNQGRNVLMRALRDDDVEVSKRAAMALQLADFAYGPSEEKYLAAIWTQSASEWIAPIMVSHYGPIFREAFIMTLNHSNPSIQKASRAGLKNGELGTSSVNPEITAFLPKPNLYPALAKAAINYPTREIVNFIGSYPPERSQALLKRLLRSESAEVVLTAYEALYETKPDLAFETLISTLRGLKPGDEKTVLALGELLAERHKDREDGFYLQFAADIITDKGMPPLAQMVGVQAIMWQDETAVPLPNAPSIAGHLKSLIDIHGTVPKNYSHALYAKLGPQSDNLIPQLYTALQSTGGQNLLVFIREVGQTEAGETPLSPAIISVLLQALNDTHDWEIAALSAKILGNNKVVEAKPALKVLTAKTPIAPLRLAGLAAISRLEGKPFQSSDHAQLNQKPITGQSCPIEAQNYKQAARQLPFFGDIKLDNAYNSGRAFLTTAVPVKKGWLAGYDRGEFTGGLVAYDNISGEGTLLYGPDNADGAAPNIKAIMPVTPVPLGQYANQFWAISGLSHRAINESFILSVSDNEGVYTVKPHMRLPRVPLFLSQLKDGSVMFGFGDKESQEKTAPFYQAPLRLWPNGRLAMACADTPKTPAGAMP